MKKYFVFQTLIMLFLLSAQTGFAQSSKELNAVKEDIKALKEGQQAIQKDVQEIKNQLKAKPAPAEFKETVINVDGDPFKGNKDAKLAVIEFSDYQWPFCSRHVRETVSQIAKDYVDTGKIRYYFLDFPLGFHKLAFKAAEAGACAGDQGKFWEMHDMLFENQKALNPEDLVKYAETLGLDMPKFKECLDGGKHTEEINKDMAEGQKAGVSGTPSSLVGWVQDDGKTVKALKIVKGAQPYPAFKDAIDSLLSPKK
jgi:protein-disulfide isomerase